jgi:FtsZ-binding cell division protein ZapB
MDIEELSKEAFMADADELEREAQSNSDKSEELRRAAEKVREAEDQASRAKGESSGWF